MKYISFATIIAFIIFSLFSLYFFESIYPTHSRVYGQPIKGDYTSIESIIHVIGLIPNLIPLIFGSEFGLLYSNPIIVFGFIFMTIFLVKYIILKKNLFSVSLLISFFVYYAFSVAIVLLWQTTGSSYGYRYLYPLVPLTLIGLYNWFNNNQLLVEPADHNIPRRWVKRMIYTLCVFSIFGQVFFKTSEPLTPKEQINIYGVLHKASVKGYNSSLPIEIFKPKTWFILAGRSFPGFFLGPIMLNSSLIEKLPNSMVEKYKARYSHPPTIAYVQVLLLFFLWILFSVFLYKIETGLKNKITKFLLGERL